MTLKVRDFTQSAVVEALIQESPDAYLALSPTGEILFWNRGAETIFGYSAKETLGRRLEDLIVPSDRVEEARQVFERALKEESVVFQSVRVRKDGSRVHVAVSKRRVLNSEGVIEFIAVSKKDITQLKSLQESLLPEQRYRSLLEAAPDAMVIVGKDGRIVLINSQTERLFGYDRSELLGQLIEILVPRRFQARHGSHRTGYFLDPKVRAMGSGLQLYGVSKGGTEFPIEISLSPIETHDGTLVTAAIRDISDRKRLEQETHRLKGEFLANMSHELRTPLNAIIGFAELMYYGKVGPISLQHKEFTGDILTSSRHLLQLINEVLDLAKVDSGKMEFLPEAIDLRRLTQDVLDTLQTLLSSKRIQVETQIDPTLVEVSLDPTKLKQVLYNFLSNAIKFTAEGRVALRMNSEEGEKFRIEVEDSGIGIREEDIGRLFIEFQQLDAGSSKNYAGTGLGLALTKRIVEAQGGQIGVTSVFGKGSTFFVVLPKIMKSEGDPHSNGR